MEAPGYKYILLSGCWALPDHFSLASFYQQLTTTSDANSGTMEDLCPLEKFLRAMEIVHRLNPSIKMRKWLLVVF